MAKKTKTRSKPEVTGGDAPPPVKVKKSKTARKAAHAASVVEGINKVLKSEHAAVTLGSVAKKDDFRRTGWLPSGLYAIDYLLGDMEGLPLGVCGTICGDEATGKSSLTQFLMMRVQDQAGVNVYYDFDGDLQPKRLRNYGLDLDNIVVPDVTTIEEAFDSMQGAFASVYGDVQGARKRKEAAKKVGVPMLCVFDSIAAASTKRRVEAESAEDAVVGRKAAVLSEQNENLRLYLRGRLATVIFINELREDIGGNPRFGRQLKMPGGRSLRYISRWMLKLNRGKSIKDSNDRVTGFIVWATTLKSSYGQPFTTQKFIISTEKGAAGGPHPAKSNMLFLKDNGLLVAKGGKGVLIRGLKDEIGVFSKREWPDVMREHDEKIRAVIRERLIEASPVGEESEGVGEGEDD